MHLFSGRRKYIKQQWGIDPCTSRMLSERSTIWATLSYCLITLKLVLKLLLVKSFQRQISGDNCTFIKHFESDFLFNIFSLLSRTMVHWFLLQPSDSVFCCAELGTTISFRSVTWQLFSLYFNGNLVIVKFFVT